MQRASYTQGNPKINVKNLPGINLTCPTTGNGGNNAVGAVQVPSVTNVFFTYAATDPRAPDASGAAGRSVSLDHMRGSSARYPPRLRGWHRRCLGLLSLRVLASSFSGAFRRTFHRRSSM